MATGLMPIPKHMIFIAYRGSGSEIQARFLALDTGVMHQLGQVLAYRHKVGFNYRVDVATLAMTL